MLKVTSGCGGVVACLTILAHAGGSGYTRLSNTALPSQGQPEEQGGLAGLWLDRQMGFVIGFSSKAKGTHWCCEPHPVGKSPHKPHSYYWPAFSSC